MESKIRAIKVNSNVLNVKKCLSLMIKEELKDTKPFKVTYISNKKAKIVRARLNSSVSTADEDSS